MAGDIKSATANFDWLEKLTSSANDLSKTLQGFFLFFLIAVLVFFALALFGSGPAERPWLLGGIGLLFVFAIGGYLYALPFFRKFAETAQQGNAQAEAVAREVAAVTPTQLVQAPIAEAEVAKQADLLIAPDGTFAFAKPGPHWDYRATTLATLTAEAFARDFGANAPPEAQIDTFLMYRPGRLVVLSEHEAHRISYGPNTKVNGRPVPALVDENFQASVFIYSVGRRGLTMSEITPEHLFAIVLGGDAAANQIVEINRVPLATEGGGALTALFARTVRTFEGVSLDGVGPVTANCNMRLYVVERGYFLYVIRAAWISGTADEERTKADIEKIVDSVRMTNTAGAEDRIRQDAADADAAFDRSMKDAAPQVFMGRASALLTSMLPPGEVPRATPENLVTARKLLDYGKAPWLGLSAEMLDYLEKLAEAVEQSVAGDSEPLKQFYDVAGGDEEPGPEEPPAVAAAG